MLLLVSCLVVLLSSLSRTAQSAITVTQNSNSVGRYDIYELSIANSGTYTNPWEDVTITGVFTAPSGKTYTVGGFYYDTGIWKLRFAPMEIGSWTWSLTFNTGAAQDTASGSFSAVSSTYRGSVRIVSGNPFRFYTDGDGKPFYVMGFNASDSLTSNYQIDPDEAQYLDLYSAAGYTLARINTEVDAAGLLQGFNFNVSGTGKNYYDIPGGKFTDSVVQYMHQRGIQILFNMIGYIGVDATLPNLSNSTYISALQHEYQYVINRYGAYVGIWQLMNERSPTQQFFNIFCPFLQTADPYQRPMTTSDMQQLTMTCVNVDGGTHINNPGFSLSVDQSYATWASNLRTTYPNRPAIIDEHVGPSYDSGNHEPRLYPLGEWASLMSEGSVLPYSYDIGSRDIGVIRAMANAMSDSDPLAQPVNLTLTAPAGVNAGAFRSYALRSSQDLTAYFVYLPSFVPQKLSGAQVSLNVPANNMQAQWIEPENGNILQTFVVNQGVQTLTIPDFDTDITLRMKPAPSTPVLQFSASFYPVKEGSGNAVITVIRTGNASGAVSADYSTADAGAQTASYPYVSAKAGTDYQSVSGTLSWANGDTSPKTFAIPITNDTLINPDRFANLKLSNPTGGAVLGNNATALLDIVDDDVDDVGFLSSAWSVSQTIGTLPLTVDRIGSGIGSPQFTYTFGEGATAPVIGTLSWANGVVGPKILNVPITNTGASSDTTLRIVQNCTSGCNSVRVSPSVNTYSEIYVTVVGNENSPGVLKFTALDTINNLAHFFAHVTDGNAIISVARTDGAVGAVSVNYATGQAGDGMVAGQDYTPVSGTLSWANGDANVKTFTVPVLNNGASGNDKSVMLTLSNPTGGAALSGGSGFQTSLGGMLTIVNNTSGASPPPPPPPAPPVITSTTSASGTAGTAFSYQIVASNSPTSFNATGLPVGLSVNAGTGLISGTPTGSGTSSITLSATNSGGTGTAILTLTVNSVPPPPPTSSPCDINRDGTTNVVDVQLEVNMALGIGPCTNPSGVCTVVSVQRVVNAALGGQCVSP